MDLKCEILHVPIEYDRVSLYAMSLCIVIELCGKNLRGGGPNPVYSKKFGPKSPVNFLYAISSAAYLTVHVFFTYTV